MQQTLQQTMLQAVPLVAQGIGDVLEKKVTTNKKQPSALEPQGIDHSLQHQIEKIPYKMLNSM